MLADLTDPQKGELLRRWRLILGPPADAPLGGGETGPGGEPREGGGRQASSLLGEADGRRDDLLEYLFGREQEARDYGANRRGAGGSSGGLTVPQWLAGVRTLFPRSTAETLQRQALERYHLRELLTDPEVLEKAPADMDTVRVLLQCRSLLSPQAMGAARRLIRKVVAALEERLARRVRNAVSGPRLRRSHGGTRALANLDWGTTIRRNLKHYRPELEVLIPERLWFWQRRRRRLPWDLILLADQSGSMLDAVIHSAVLAAIFHGLSTLRTRLILFDTRVLDLTGRVADPAEVLLGVQLGGGTDIGAALAYARTKVDNPRRTLLVVVSDFYDGGDRRALLRLVAGLHQSGVVLLGLAALDERAEPDYDRALGRELVDCGMAIAAMTPDRLADWVGEVMAGRGG